MISLFNTLYILDQTLCPNIAFEQLTSKLEHKKGLSKQIVLFLF